MSILKIGHVKLKTHFNETSNFRHKNGRPRCGCGRGKLVARSDPSAPWPRAQGRRPESGRACQAGQHSSLNQFSWRWAQSSECDWKPSPAADGKVPEPGVNSINLRLGLEWFWSNFYFQNFSLTNSGPSTWFLIFQSHLNKKHPLIQIHFWPIFSIVRKFRPQLILKNGRQIPILPRPPFPSPNRDIPGTSRGSALTRTPQSPAARPNRPSVNLTMRFVFFCTKHVANPTMAFVVHKCTLYFIKLLPLNGPPHILWCPPPRIG
jgi:hypothetical protein